MSDKHESIVPYILVLIALIILTVLTVWVAFQDFGILNTPIALGIAGLKATLVILIFMHALHSEALTKLFICCGFIWLLVLFGFTLSDYFTRDWPAVQQENSWITKSPEHFEVADHSGSAHH